MLDTVTLHVSVWVEIENEFTINNNTFCHAPRERVSWNSTFCEICCQGDTESRSTWACELKCNVRMEWLWTHSHAPRERVSWNMRAFTELKNLLVTLHVSVWVEIVSRALPLYLNTSRSTWACELKFSVHSLCDNWIARHAPRERVSWNWIIYVLFRKRHCHAPRERVSWNEEIKESKRKEAVTLHVSVWVEIIYSKWPHEVVESHAPRERVSWNLTARA